MHSNTITEEKAVLKTEKENNEEYCRGKKAELAEMERMQ